MEVGAVVGSAADLSGVRDARCDDRLYDTAQALHRVTTRSISITRGVSSNVMARRRPVIPSRGAPSIAMSHAFTIACVAHARCLAPISRPVPLGMRSLGRPLVPFPSCDPWTVQPASPLASQLNESSQARAVAASAAPPAARLTHTCGSSSVAQALLAADVALYLLALGQKTPFYSTRCLGCLH